MGRTRRKKKRTQKEEVAAPGPASDKVPRSFVLSRGKIPAPLRLLEHDLRKLMQPHTALHLKERKNNSLKDFVNVAGPLGVTHFLMLSSTEKAPYLRVARCPHGPTLTYKIISYSLAADVARSQQHPRSPASIFKCSPLIVLAGFGTEEHLKLSTIMFQNIFPAIDVNNVKLATCQRVVLLSYNKEEKQMEFRHYAVTLQPVGVSRRLRKLVQQRKIPNLRSLNDVSEFIMKAGYGSESEAEDERRSATVELASDCGRLNRASEQSSVKLHELGPRMTLQLVKVEEGLCSGAVIFHEFVKKTPEEIALLKQNREKMEALKKQRKAEQEANVQQKELAKKKKNRFSKHSEEYQAKPEGKEEEDSEDDADWYRKEVGQEPDAEFLSGVRRAATRRPPDSSKPFNKGRLGRESEDRRAPKSPAPKRKRPGQGIADKILAQRKHGKFGAHKMHAAKRARTK